MTMVEKWRKNNKIEFPVSSSMANLWSSSVLSKTKDAKNFWKEIKDSRKGGITKRPSQHPIPKQVYEV